MRFRRKLARPAEPLDPAEVEFCTRWAQVWFGLARRARELDEQAMGDRFMAAGEDVYDALEVRNERDERK